MSDRESENSPTGQTAEANGSASFSTNGNDPGGFGEGAAMVR